MQSYDVTADESKRFREVAERAAAAASPQLLSAFRSPVEVSFKRDEHDVVTEHDRAAEASIWAAILAEVPDSRILGEETGDRGSGRIQWIIDPIDGTANFARGLAYWCISIAVAVEGDVVAGVILDPVARNLFAADLHGATLNGEPIRSAAADRADRATVLTSFPSAHDLAILGDDALPLLAEMVTGFRHVHSLGSGALNLAHVAAGWADVTMGFDTKPWDVAAGAFILGQGGGQFTGFCAGAAHTPHHRAEDYVAVGHGATYPALTGSVMRLSGERRGSV